MDKIHLLEGRIDTIDSWVNSVHLFLSNTDREVIKRNIIDLLDKCDVSEDFRVVYNQYLDEIRELKNSTTDIFLWRSYKYIIDKNVKKIINDRLNTRINHRISTSHSQDDTRIKLIEAALNKMKVRYKDNMSDIANGRALEIQKHKERMKSWTELEEMCKRQHKDYLDFNQLLMDNRKEKLELIDFEWLKLDESTRSINYFSDFMQFRAEKIVQIDRGFLLSNIDNGFIKKILENEINSSKDEKMYEKMKEEIHALILEHNFDFLDEQGFQANRQ